MSSSFTLSIPSQVPAITLPEVVLFPQAIMPLYIYETRYRTMLKTILDTNRLLIVAGQNHEKAEKTGLFEPHYEIASVGIIRASHQAEDGSSNLIIQGLKRVRVKGIAQEDPYRIVNIEVIESDPETCTEQLNQQQAALGRLFDVHLKLGGRIPTEIMGVLNNLNDPEIFLDIAAYTLCNETNEKQKLLEILNTDHRYRYFIDYFRKKNQALAIDKKLRGGLDDEQISCNWYPAFWNASQKPQLAGFMMDNLSIVTPRSRFTWTVLGVACSLAPRSHTI